MIKAILARFESSDLGTYGRFTVPGFSCFFTERPWLNNQKQISCIPAGLYVCKWHKSPKFGWCYEVTNVPGRGNILIHAGNYYWNSHGCLLPCKKLGYIDGKKAGLLSKPAVLALNTFFNKQSFLLEIRDDYIVNSPSIERSYGFAGRLDWRLSEPQTRSGG